MKPVINLFENELKRMRDKKWDCIYVAIDLHGTIFKSSYENDEKYEFYPCAAKALRYMTHDKDFKLILWTCTEYKFLRKYLDVLEEHNIFFDAINGNPFEETTKTNVKSMSFKDKFYFNIGLDDKFGFDPETDWDELYTWLVFIKDM